MNPAPLHQLLQALATAHRNGASLAPLGAQVDPDGQLTIHTDRGPLHLWLHNLEAAAAGAMLREEARRERLRDRLHQAPRIAPAAAPAPVAAPTAKPIKHEPLPSWSAHRMPLGRAPKRAVGNFTTEELRQRTIHDLSANLHTAMANGCEALAKVMREALAVALERPVDERCPRTGLVSIPKGVK
ncbi:MAG: hypothetical protein QY325_04330 [Flavobacteriales bacterium]|nr:MAG: hypothetical protein QY325_04330 [Flavobacteriales bacterium]